MEYVAAVLALAGVGTSIWSQIKQGQDAEEAAQRNAAIKEAQAQELLSREMVNENIMQEQGDQAALEYGTKGGGVVDIGGMLRLKRNVESNIALSRRDAAYKARMLRMGADVDLQLGSDQKTASILGAVGTGASGAANAYSLYKKNGTSPGYQDDAGNGKMGGYFGGEYSGPTYSQNPSTPAVDFSGEYGGLTYPRTQSNWSL